MYAIILAAGRGIRAWPATNDIPKPMIRIAGKPLLEHQIEWLKSGGVTKIIIDEGYKASEIDKYFHDGSKFDVSIIHRVDPDLSIGAVGHIKGCLQQVPDDEDDRDVVIMAGDVLTTAHLPTFVAAHKERALPLTLFGKELQLPLGIIVADKEGHITDLRERPTIDATYVNTSIGVVQRNIESHLSAEGHNFWGEALRIFRGSIYTEPGAAWWHLTDISDAYRMDGEVSDLKK